MSDPIAAYIRREREVLLRAAPPPHAARVWHQARRRRAAALRRAMSAAGWVVRLVVTAAVLLSFSVRPETWFLLLIVALVFWLTNGACGPIHSHLRKDNVQ